MIITDYCGIVKDHPDIFDTHIVTKLNGNDVKFFYDVNTESRRAIQRSGVRLPQRIRLGFCPASPYHGLWRSVLNIRRRFCAQMALNGNVDLLEFLHEKDVLGIGVLVLLLLKMVISECLKYARSGCPWDEETCSEAASEGHLECLKYAQGSDCPG